MTLFRVQGEYDVLVEASDADAAHEYVVWNLLKDAHDVVEWDVIVHGVEETGL